MCVNLIKTLLFGQETKNVMIIIAFISFQIKLLRKAYLKQKLNCYVKLI